MAEERDREEGENRRHEHRGEQEVARDVQDADAVGEDEGGEDVERRLFGHAGEGGEYDLLRVALDDLQSRRPLDFALGQQFAEDRRLKKAKTNIKPDPE